MSGIGTSPWFLLTLELACRSHMDASCFSLSLIADRSHRKQGKFHSYPPQVVQALIYA